jgi:hypothetical protein
VTAVERARSLVSETTKTWDPANVDACEEAGHSLAAAIAQIETVKQQALAGGQLTSVDVAELTAIRSDLVRFTRRLDAANAFLRGMNGFDAAISGETGLEASVRA